MLYQINDSVFNSFPELNCDRLSLKEITPRDKEAMYSIRSNINVMRFMGREAMHTLSEAEAFILSVSESFQKKNGINWGIIENESARFIGYFGIWRIDADNCRGEIGFALHPDFWGKGYMIEAAKAILRFGFEGLNLHSFEANIDPDNISSVKLVEKLGFRKEAYFHENFLFNGKFYDSMIYSLLEDNFH